MNIYDLSARSFPQLPLKRVACLILTLALSLGLTIHASALDNSNTVRLGLILSGAPLLVASDSSRDTRGRRRRRYGRNYRRHRSPVTRALSTAYRKKKAAVLYAGRGARRIVPSRSRNRRRSAKKL